MANVAFDYTNLVDSTGGIGDRELRDLRPRLDEAVGTFLEDPPGFMRLPETNEFSEPSKVLAEEGHEGKVYTLTGPAAISFYDVAEALSEVLGKEVGYINIPLGKAKEAMLNRGIPEWRADALNEYAKAHSEGYSDWTTDDVEQITGHPATSYKEFATDFERVFRGA